MIIITISIQYSKICFALTDEVKAKISKTQYSRIEQAEQREARTEGKLKQPGETQNVKMDTYKLKD